MIDLMTIWNKFRKIPKEHTKPFKRRGGFQGTAIKPMYSIQLMTEQFGACGIGWGYTKPDFEVTTEQDGQKLVYCTVGLWFMKDGVKSDLVYGCGGDFVVSKGDYGLKPDDEAFKKSFTDALMNAMKHIGMAADIHMGLFDGNKYVDEKPEGKNDIRGGVTAENLAIDWPVEARKAEVDKLITKLATVTKEKLPEAKKYTNKIIKNLKFVGSNDLASELEAALFQAIEDNK